MATKDRLHDAVQGINKLAADSHAARKQGTPAWEPGGTVATRSDGTPVAARPEGAFTGGEMALARLPELEAPRRSAVPAVVAGVAALLTVGGVFWLTRPREVVAAAAAPTAAQPGLKPGMPNPELTPGERDSRPHERAEVPEAAAAEVLRAYGADPAKNVVVRLIPASLGGTDHPKNLFPVTPWFRDLKTRLDRKLTELVAAKEISVEEADRQLRENWISAVHKHYIRNYGMTDAEQAKRKEDELPW
jgi:hypothetical protein